MEKWVKITERQKEERWRMKRKREVDNIGRYRYTEGIEGERV